MALPDPQMAPPEPGHTGSLFRLQQSRGSGEHTKRTGVSCTEHGQCKTCTCGMFLRALDTKPLLGQLADFLLTPLGCIKGHLRDFKLSNLNTVCHRAQQFSSYTTVTISGQKVKINIMKRVELLFISICCKCHHAAGLRSTTKTRRFLVIPRFCTSQPSKNEREAEPSPFGGGTNELCTLPWQTADPGCVGQRGSWFTG